MTTPSKRSMERAEEVMEERARMQKDTVTIIALAFDRLVDDCAEVAEPWSVIQQSDPMGYSEPIGKRIAKAIRLKLKGGEE